jgi:hypothetical protein
MENFKKFVFLIARKSRMLQSTPLTEISSLRFRAVTSEGWQIGLPKVDGFHYMFNMY